MKVRIQHVAIHLLLVVSFACNTSKTKISGVIEGGSDQTITLERLDVNRTSIIDSVKLKKDGSFTFKTVLEEPELYLLKNESGEIVNLLPSPGEKVSVLSRSDSFSSGYQVTGSVESENIRLLVEHLDQTRSDIDSLLQVADSIDTPDSPQMDLIRTAYTQLIIKQKRFTIRYLVENMTSLSSIYALYQKYDTETFILGSEPDFQYFKTVADSLESVHPNSSLTKSLRADIEEREARFKETNKINELLSLAGEATGLLDINLPDREGEDVLLSDLKGKVIMVYFWASGNQASVQSLLQLQPTYSKYHSRGFEVYAISLDNNKISWMNSMDFNEFEWINVSELTYPNSRANLLYNVTELPSAFLVNREGDIVAKNILGRNLETWLDNLL